MRRRGACLAAFLVVLPPAVAYVRLIGIHGQPVQRADFRNVRFLINESLAAGRPNADGEPMITAGSDPHAAIRNALASWAAVSETAIRFAPVTATTAGFTSGDGMNVIMLADTPEFRSVVGSALAITRNLEDTRGIIESDILLSPRITANGRSLPFSTTGATGTFDLESTVAHEIGHALGANHTGLIGATMHFAGLPGRTHQVNLSTDDIAFLREAYPAEGSESRFGTLSGTVRIPGGRHVSAAVVTAVDTDSGVALGTVTGSTGAYFMARVPPGRYLVYAEPLDGPVFPGNISLERNEVDADFKPAFFGGAVFPTTVAVGAGRPISAEITVEEGQSGLRMEVIGGAPPGGAGSIGDGAQQVPSGGAHDIVVFGPGLDQRITRDNIRLVGPGLSVRANSIRVNPQVVANGFPGLFFTVEVAPRSRRDMASIVVTRGSDMATYSGALILEPSANAAEVSSAAIVSAAAVRPGPVAPDSWVSLFGTGVAPALVVADSVPLPLHLGNTQVRVRDRRGNERAAMLQFVAPGQVNFLMPPETEPGATLLRLIGPAGESRAAVQVEPVAPGLFTANSDGRGAPAAIALRVAAGGAQTTQFVFQAEAQIGNRSPVPIDLGPPGDQVFLLLFGTGIRRFTQGVAVRVGGVDVPVVGAAAQGQFAGLDQVNIGPLPRSLAGRGDVELTLEVDGKPANLVRLNIR